MRKIKNKDVTCDKCADLQSEIDRLNAIIKGSKRVNQKTCNWTSKDGNKYILRTPKGNMLQGYQFQDEEHCRKWLSQPHCAEYGYKASVIRDGMIISTIIPKAKP